MDIRQQSEQWIEGASKWDRGVLVTINVWDYLSTNKDWKTIFRIQNKITQLRNTIEKRIFKDTKKHIEIFPVIETDTSSNHIHILSNTPQHMRRKHYIKDIERSI